MTGSAGRPAASGKEPSSPNRPPTALEHPGPRLHLQALAQGPRPTGSEAAARARAYCVDVLSSLGFAVTERPFIYSAFPGRYGTPAGGTLTLTAIWCAALFATAGHPSAALAILVLTAVLLAAGGSWLARRGILSLSLHRAAGVNVEATRGVGTPRVWLAAHVDSKSQPVPLAARAAGITVLSLAYVAALLLAAASAATGGGWHPLWWWIGGVAAIAALPVIATLVGTRSAGAVDNASGVATVLAAAALLPRHLPIGVLVTDAEELGLAGARAWCNQRPAGIVVNCDGVDDGGALTAMYTRPRPPRLTAALVAAASRQGRSVRVRPLLPGVLVDGVAFADAGWEAITMSRGTLATLRRIHTARDDLRAMRGDGIDDLARVMADAARSLMEND